MLLIRRPSFVASLVVALLGTAAFPPALAAHGGAVRPPITELAILPRRPRVRRLIRFAGVRVIALRILGLRQGLEALRARGQNVCPRPPLRDCYARGPPWGRGARRGAKPVSIAGRHHAARLCMRRCRCNDSLGTAR